MPEIRRPVLERTDALLVMEDTGLYGKTRNVRHKEIKDAAFAVPDVFAYIQAKTGLTRQTIARILKDSQRLPDIFK